VLFLHREVCRGVFRCRKGCLVSANGVAPRSTNDEGGAGAPLAGRAAYWPRCAGKKPDCSNFALDYVAVQRQHIAMR
jgi:hypothetical protein